MWDYAVGRCVWLWGRPTCGIDPVIGSDNPKRFEDQNILNVPNASILYIGSWYLG